MKTRLALIIAALVVATAASAVAAPGVCVREAEPFVVRQADGGWTGAAIALWDHVAVYEGIEFEYIECSLDEALKPDGTAIIASVGAFTVTADREADADFTTPFYSTSLGVASRSQPWARALVLKLWSAVPYIGLLALVLWIVGFGYIVLQGRPHRDAADYDRQLFLDVFINGPYWAGTTNTTTGYGDEVPTTWASKLYALAWQYVSALTYALLIGAIAAGFSTSPLEHDVQGVDDLRGLVVGVESGTFAADYLGQLGVETIPMTHADELPRAGADVFVDDRALLLYQTIQTPEVATTPARFSPSFYSLVLPTGSPHAEGIDRRILEFTGTRQWEALLDSYFLE